MKLSTASKILVVAFVAAIALVAVQANAASYVFTRTLKVGSTGTDVMNLQKVLNASADTQVAVTGAGSPGMESTYFGAKTKAAVIKFQEKYAAQILTPVGLTSGTGLVGASTRALLNNWSTNTNGGSNPPVVISGPVSVALASTPNYGALVSPSATAQLASFTFTGSGVVSNVNLQRIGVSSDQTLNAVYLYDGAVRLTDAASVSNGNISFNNPSGLFVVSGSRTVTVRADIATGQGGATVGINLANYTVVGGSSVTANIAGATQNIASNITAATVQLAANSIAAQSVNAGATNLAVWSSAVNVGNRSVYLQALTFKYIGSAPTNALTNTQLLVDGAVVANGSIDANSYLTFNLSGAPLTLTTGSHTLTVQTNVVGGAYRNFQLSLQNSGDLMVADSQLQGVNVAPTTSGYSTFQVNNGGLITINNGTVSVQVDPAFNPTTVTGGATNVAIAQFKFTSYGEDVKVNSLQVEPQIGGADTSLNNVAVYVNGGQVGSTQNDATTTLTFGTNNLFTIPAGQTVIVTIKADTISAQNTSYSSGSLTVKLPAGSSNAQGVQSSQLVSVPSGITTSNAITIGSGAPTVAKNTSLANFTTSPNVNNVKIGSFVIQASSAEGLRVNNVVITLNGGLGVTNPSQNFSNLKVVTPAGTTNPVAAQTTNSFSISGLVLPTSGSAVIDVYADILGNNGSASTSISVSAQGATSNTAVTGTAVGQDVTVGTGQLYTPTLTSTSPVAQYVVSGTGGSSSFNLATYNFVSTTSPALIQELHFAVTGTSSIASISVTGPGMTTPVSAPVVGGVANVSGLSISIPVGYAGGNVVVTPTYAQVGLNGLTSPTTSSITLNYVKALVGNSTITPSLNVVAPASGSISLVASKPTVTIASSGSTLSGGSVNIAKITVTADAAGPISVNQIPLTLTQNGGTTLASQALVIKDANGTTISNATSSTFAAASSTSPTSTGAIGFTSGYRIEAGQSMTFYVYATTGGSLGNSGTSNLVTSISSAGGFTWTDINGASSAGGLTGTLLTNWPTNTAVITN